MSHGIVLLSGGIDSATCFAMAVSEHDRVTPLHIQYGQQTADLEQMQAEALVSYFQAVEGQKTTIEDVVVIDYTDVFKYFADGVASDRQSFVTHSGSLEERDGRSTGYVPMRNLHFIATGAGYADFFDADAVYIGVQGGDYHAYPDCRPGFIVSAFSAVNRSLPEGQTIDIKTPLVDKTKVEVIETGEAFGVPWEATYSCYQEVHNLEAPTPCGQCPACKERAEAFEEAGVSDPFAVEVDV